MTPQLECTNHISMAPGADAAGGSVSSNELYARGVEKVFNETGDNLSPGLDYSYLSTYYAPQWRAPDLREQIDRFLARPKPRYAPQETLWVFSFGLWDVWSLSALPTSVSKDLTGEMTKDIFAQIDRLVEASTDERSIAWSDANFGKAAATTNASDEETKEEAPADADAPADAPAEGPTEKREEEADAAAAAAAEKEAEEAAEAEAAGPTEYFRVLIPRIMDPSLLPGWRDLRPVLPKVHSKAEQMRNCVALTNAWNDGIVAGLSDWVKKEDKKPGPEEEKKEEGGEKKERRDGDDVAPAEAAAVPAEGAPEGSTLR